MRPGFPHTRQRLVPEKGEWIGGVRERHDGAAWKPGIRVVISDDDRLSRQSGQAGLPVVATRPRVCDSLGDQQLVGQAHDPVIQMSAPTRRLARIEIHIEPEA